MGTVYLSWAQKCQRLLGLAGVSIQTQRRRGLLGYTVANEIVGLCGSHSKSFYFYLKINKV
jgi:hypothetical protein